MERGRVEEREEKQEEEERGDEEKKKREEEEEDGEMKPNTFTANKNSSVIMFVKSYFSFHGKIS